MQVHVAQHSPSFMHDLERLRLAAFRRRGRDEAYLARWSRDHYDRAATHVIAYDEHGAMIGAVRLILDDPWPLDEYCSAAYDKVRGVELGRLVVSTACSTERRIMFDLVAAAAKYSQALGKKDIYGAIIIPLQIALHRAHFPHRVLSPVLSTYGEQSNLVCIRIEDVLRYYHGHTADPREWPASRDEAKT
jgi:N-acyl-L-homoserine lactone synthetase